MKKFHWLIIKICFNVSQKCFFETKITENENRELVDTTQNVLVVEKGSKGGFIAKTDSYLPVIVDDVELGSFVKVKITDATSTYLKSELLKE